MPDETLPGWAAGTKRVANCAFHVFGALFLVRCFIAIVTAVFGDASWDLPAPLWLGIPSAVALAVAALCGLVWIVGEFVAGFRTERI